MHDDYYKPTKENKPPTTIKEAFIQEAEAKKHKHGSLGTERLKEGKCPSCGVLGRYHLSTPICPEHGPY